MCFTKDALGPDFRARADCIRGGAGCNDDNGTPNSSTLEWVAPQFRNDDVQKQPAQKSNLNQSDADESEFPFHPVSHCFIPFWAC
jgi:hypothetical protein